MIHFSEERWQEIKKNYEAWWQGTLPRPLIRHAVRRFDPGRSAPNYPLLSQANCHDFSISPADIVDAMDYELSQYDFLEDAYPFINMDCFGPGVLAAFCGASLDNSSGRVWLFPKEQMPIDKIHIHYDPDNIWAKRIKSIYRAGINRWEGNVLMSMPDFGGIMDVMATFRGSEDLLMDLYDAPEEVHRLRGEIYEAWQQAYDDMSKALIGNPGYSDWNGVYSEKPAYILQSDFSYMISTPMFDTFVLPDIQRACKDLHHAMYHLDGVGELNHLDHLLEIPKLKAVQWVYGDGQPGPYHWLDVYKKITAAGKRIQVIGSREDVEMVQGVLPNSCIYSSF